MKIKWIVKKYQARIKRILKNIRDVIVKAGHPVTSVEFLDGDDGYSWCIFVGDLDKGKGIDITFKLCESYQYDASDDGINFALDMVEYGGRILGSFSPYNYTKQVWVNPRNKQAVEARFCLMEQCDADGVLKIINAELNKA